MVDQTISGHPSLYYNHMITPTHTPHHLKVYTHILIITPSKDILIITPPKLYHVLLLLTHPKLYHVLLTHDHHVHTPTLAQSFTR